MKRVTIRLEVEDDNTIAYFGEQVEDRLAIIIGRLGFEGYIESDLTDNHTSIPTDENDSTETQWVDKNIVIKKRIIGGPVCNVCKRIIRDDDEARDCCDDCLEDDKKAQAKEVKRIKKVLKK